MLRSSAGERRERSTDGGYELFMDLYGRADLAAQRWSEGQSARPRSHSADATTDDLFFRRQRDAARRPATHSDHEGLVVAGQQSRADYASARPDGRYRSRRNPSRRHDLVRDDMAYRSLRRLDQRGTSQGSLAFGPCSREWISSSSWPEISK